MSAPPTPSKATADRLIAVVAQGIERYELEGEHGLREVCLEHPDLAGALLERLARLAELGLLAAPP